MNRDVVPKTKREVLGFVFVMLFEFLRDCCLGLKKVLFFVLDFVLEVVGLLMIFGLCVFVAICSSIMRVFDKDSQGRILP